VIDSLLEAIRAGVITSAHDCSDGGLGIALAECCVADRDNAGGADIDLSAWKDIPNRAILFGETQGRIVVSTSAPERVLEIAKNAGVPCSRIGTVRRKSENLTIKLPDSILKAPLARLARAFHDTIPSIMSRTPEHTTLDEVTPVAAH
jgi:phosphoribosylformylglycinamidine synthase